jgi:pyrimidine deaminase RibD-like protein
MSATEHSRQHMEAAIALSERAGIIEKTGRCFGAVVVDGGGQVVGEGYNQVILHDL